MNRAILLMGVFTLVADGATGVRILLGTGDQAATNWDGGVTANGANIVAVEPWRFDTGDAMQPGNSWKMSTHEARRFAAAGVTAAVAPQMVANGVVVLVDNETAIAELSVRTAQGNFSIRLSEIPYGTPRRLLNGRAMVERIPAWSRVTGPPDEEDFPAAAVDKSGTVWVAYLDFKHHPDHDRIRLTPNQFDWMNARPGGDQIMLKSYSNGTWSDPIAVSAAGGDLYRPTIAVDGRGRVWVFWPANERGNFDIWARVVEGGKAGATVRISNAPGSDIDPAAATDSAGNVWVAWQGWRDGKARIFAASQKGSAFSAPVTVASSGGNEWDPAIAADGSGHVSVAWDSYRNGNYDVFIRTATNGTWGEEKTVAASAAYQAYPSIAYDPAGTAWIAYEEGGEGWGKNFGADDSSGIALYQGRAIRLRGVTPSGAMVETATDIGTALPGLPASGLVAQARQGEDNDFIRPDPNAAKNRGPAASAPARRAPRNTLPRMTIDASGRIWLVCRSAFPVFWNPIGTVWTEYLVSYSGSTWTGPMYLHHSDNLLDNRPAVVSAKAGEALVIGSSDARREYHAISYMPGAQTSGPNELPKDPYSNDLYANQAALGPASGPPSAKNAAPSEVSGVDARDKTELDAVATMRRYRLQTREGPLMILRGEFHRHSEISMDGGGDGTILDQYRYLIDGSYMDWAGCCDHDNGAAREYTWWLSQKLTDIFYAPAHFVAMFNYERSVAYPEGHRNVIFAQRGIRPLPRLQKTSDTPVVRAPDTAMLYAYLKKFDGVVASHTSATNMGTDWRDNDPDSEPVVEIYQGDRQNYEMPGAPRSSSENDSIGGWRPKGFVNLALERGYKLAFEASSDHVSTHMSYSNILAKAATREALLDALKKRHVYGATDHILAEYRCGDHIMGDAFSSATPPVLQIKLVGTAPFSKVFIVKDSAYVYSTEPGKSNVEFTWRDSAPVKGKTSYYYVRGEQSNGELVWVSPMWITYTGQ
ncbi:MAG TPA: hypothetical protein VNX18_22725 [Bryobacteraceae bacterium]|jgi:hypothetical protein|nr:hypothetical protein [Bryobacteraceae bacterium]